MKRIFVLKVTLLSALFCSTAFSSVVTYTNRAAFEAAAGALQTITFNGLLAADGSESHDNSTGLTFLNVQFIGGPASGQSNQLRLFNANAFDVGTGPEVLASLETILAVLPAGTRAIGADVGASAMIYVSPGSTSVVGLTNGVDSILNGIITTTRVSFLGMISDTPLAGVAFVSGSSFLVVDNVSFGNRSPSAVPEPASFLFCLPALAVLYGIRGRIKPA